ncbi:hypothetical protein VNO78_18232 [Psophocarpus tetragonolobus]|uniref:Uncharacterized protein n=1 Tax=Psophocarpus tetragonolobus TaxID=3891 RepID=A0AAN9XLN1_PSOTE
MCIFLSTSSYLNTDGDGLIYYNVFVSVGLAGSCWTKKRKLPCMINASNGLFNEDKHIDGVEWGNEMLCQEYNPNLSFLFWI